MIEELQQQQELLARAAGGDAVAVNDLILSYRERLKRMVHLRLRRALQGLVVDEDVIQEAHVEIDRRL
jgi:RNA polymerase sigma-70 factor, ECF subfamily